MKSIGYYLRRIALGISILGMFIGFGYAYWIGGDDCQGGQGCYIRTLNPHFYESNSTIMKVPLVIPAYISRCMKTVISAGSTSFLLALSHWRC